MFQIFSPVQLPSLSTSTARYVSQYPYCGSFQPPLESGLSPSFNPFAEGVIVNPPINNQTVFECKYEIDSLCGFIKLSRSYYQATNDSSIMNENCMVWLSSNKLALQLVIQGRPLSTGYSGSLMNNRREPSTGTSTSFRSTTGLEVLVHFPLR